MFSGQTWLSIRPREKLRLGENLPSLSSCSRNCTQTMKPQICICGNSLLARSLDWNNKISSVTTIDFFCLTCNNTHYCKHWVLLNGTYSTNFVEFLSVADLGFRSFPRESSDIGIFLKYASFVKFLYKYCRGREPCRGRGFPSNQSYISKILHAEMKESGPLGGRAPGTPPRAANVIRKLLSVWPIIYDMCG